jgi:hypothetical protein
VIKILYHKLRSKFDVNFLNHDCSINSRIEDCQLSTNFQRNLIFIPLFFRLYSTYWPPSCTAPTLEMCLRNVWRRSVQPIDQEYRQKALQSDNQCVWSCSRQRDTVVHRHANDLQVTYSPVNGLPTDWHLIAVWSTECHSHDQRDCKFVMLGSYSR